MQVLIKPYTKKAKREFIEKYKSDCRFEESEKALWALKYYEILEGNTVFFMLRDIKYIENDKKADEKRYNQEFTIKIQDKDCTFDTSSKTQNDLLTAFAVCSQCGTYDGWITNNEVEINLTLEDVVLVLKKLQELSNVYCKWAKIKEQIDNAVTIGELEAIEIDYNKEVENEVISIETPVLFGNKELPKKETQEIEEVKEVKEDEI